MEKPLISVIIPTFNEERNIAVLLASIKLQKYPRIEVVVVDDSSTDKTVEVAKGYTNLVFKRKHLERSAQRNFGACKAKGNLLVFLDADMELTAGVIGDIEETFQKGFSAIVIPEKTVGKSYLSKVRNFEREMYMGDSSIEVARAFKRDVFFEFGGYDEDLTGPEDYDLPYRISKKHKIGRSSKYILHHEEELTLARLLKKKFYYANKGASYAKKHPELILTQGNILFRKAYFRNWKKFINHPVLGISFIAVRVLEAFFALLGYGKAMIKLRIARKND